MRKFYGIVVLLACVGLLMSGCTKIPAGYRGIKVYLYGTSKGVDMEELGVGRYWRGFNVEYYKFPTFTQNYVWTADRREGSRDDESVTFQTIEGLGANADVGISYHIKADKVGLIFQKYRKGIDEITDVFLRNMVRDAFNQVGSKSPVESVYGKGKSAFISDVEEIVRTQVEEIGIVIERIYLVGTIRLPQIVVDALNNKIKATQKAQQSENELREAEAEAKKKVAQAKGDAESTITRAESQAKANLLLARSITPVLVQYEAIKKWNGDLPKFVGGNGVIPMINIDGK